MIIPGCVTRKKDAGKSVTLGKTVLSSHKEENQLRPSVYQSDSPNI